MKVILILIGAIAALAFIAYAAGAATAVNLLRVRRICPPNSELCSSCGSAEQHNVLATGGTAHVGRRRLQVGVTRPTSSQWSAFCGAPLDAKALGALIQAAYADVTARLRS